MGRPRSSHKEVVMSYTTETPRFSETPREINADHMSVLFLIDSSGSMSGTAISNAVAGINGFRAFLGEDPEVRACVDVCVMQFDDSVRLVQDWVPVMDMQPVSISAGGCTALYDGVNAAIDKIRERSRTYASLGVTERKPYLVILSDGHDNASSYGRAAAVELVANRINGGKLKLFFLGYEDYDRTVAAELTSAGGTKRAVAFEVTGPAAPFKDFFDFVANSTKAASTSAPGANLVVPTIIGTNLSPVKPVDLSGWLND